MSQSLYTENQLKEALNRLPNFKVKGREYTFKDLGIFILKDKLNDSGRIELKKIRVTKIPNRNMLISALGVGNKRTSTFSLTDFEALFYCHHSEGLTNGRCLQCGHTLVSHTLALSGYEQGNDTPLHSNIKLMASQVGDYTLVEVAEAILMKDISRLMEMYETLQDKFSDHDIDKAMAKYKQFCHPKYNISMVNGLLIETTSHNRFGPKLVEPVAVDGDTFFLVKGLEKIPVNKNVFTHYCVHPLSRWSKCLSCEGELPDQLPNKVDEVNLESTVQKLTFLIDTERRHDKDGIFAAQYLDAVIFKDYEYLTKLCKLANVQQGIPLVDISEEILPS